MTLHLRILSGGGDHSKLERLLREKFADWTEDIHVDLIRYGQGWVIVNAMGTLPSGRGFEDELFQATSCIVRNAVLDVLEDAREPIRPATMLARVMGLPLHSMPATAPRQTY